MTWTQKLLAAAIFPAMLVALGACTTKFKEGEDGDVDADAEVPDGAEEGVDAPDGEPDGDAPEIEARYTFAPGNVQAYNYPGPVPMDFSMDDRVALRVIHEEGRLVVFVVYDTDPTGSMEPNVGVMALPTGDGGSLPLDFSTVNAIVTPMGGEIEMSPDSVDVVSFEDYYYLFQLVRDHGAGMNASGNVRVLRIRKSDLSGDPEPVLLFERSPDNPDLTNLTAIREGAQVYMTMTDDDIGAGSTSYGATVNEGFLEDLHGGMPPPLPSWTDATAGAAIVGTSASNQVSMVATLARYQSRTAVGHQVIDLDSGSIHTSIMMFDGNFRPGQHASATIDLCATEACAGMPNIVAMPMLLNIDFPTAILFVSWMTSDSIFDLDNPGHTLPPPYMLHGGRYGGGSTISSGFQTPPLNDNIVPYDLRRMVSMTDYRILLRRPEEIVYVWPSYAYDPHWVGVSFYLTSLGFDLLIDPAPVSVDTGMTQDLCRFYGFGAAVDVNGVVYLVWNNWEWTGIPTDGLMQITGLSVMPVQFLPIE